MAKTPGERGDFGRWLERARTERYKTQKDALRAMEKLAGLKIAESEYAQWESGSRVPRHGNPKVARLYEFFGSKPEPEPPEAPPADLATAILALTQELGEWRRDREELVAKVEGLEELVGRLVGLAGAVSPAPPVPDGTRE